MTTHQSTNGTVRNRAPFLLFFILWFCILAFGFVDSATRHVPDYPNARRPVIFIGQVELYVLVPLCFLLANGILLFYNKLPKIIVWAAALIQTILLLAFIAFSGGGI
jgi:hypothetical protein